MLKCVGVAWAVAVVVGACGGDDRVGLVEETGFDDAEDVAEAVDLLFEVAGDSAPTSDGEDATDKVDSVADADVAAEVDVDLDVEIDGAVDTREVEVAPIDCGDCDDLLACTNDVCGPDGVCVHNVKAGSCKVAGECVAAGHGPDPCRICAPDINPNGLTSLTGGPCDDGDPCTTDEQCTLGSCAGGIVRPCEASSVCHVSLGCDAVNGCMEEAKPEGTPCGAGSACEVVEASLPEEPPTIECVEGDAMPAGSIAWFDALRCPTGWEQYAAATGRTLVPVGPLGPEKGVGEDGTPLLSGAQPVHTHVVTGTVGIGSQRFIGVAGGGNGLAQPGSVAVSGTSEAASLGLPYVQLLACHKTSDHVLGAAPTGVFVFAEAALGCGADWIATDEGAERLVVGVPSGASAGATFGAPPGLATRASHTHGVSGNFAIDSHGIALASGCCSPDFASSADPFVDYVSGAPEVSEATTFPWRAELQCMLAEPVVPSPVADTAPPGIVLFASDDTCPVGWSPLDIARGRLIVAAATGGDVGVTVGNPLGDREDRSHRHNVRLQLTLAQKNIAAANGPNQDGAAPGLHDATFLSAPATSRLPFRQLLACTKP